jgi:hypothetical protein
VEGERGGGRWRLCVCEGGYSVCIHVCMKGKHACTCTYNVHVINTICTHMYVRVNLVNLNHLHLSLALTPPRQKHVRVCVSMLC